MMLGFGTVISIMILTSVYGLIILNAVSDVAKVTLTSNVKSVDIAKQLKGILFDESAYAQKYLISNDNNYRTLFLETRLLVEETLKSLSEVLSAETDSLFIEKMRKAHNSFVSSMLGGIVMDEIGFDSAGNNARLNYMNSLHSLLDGFISQNQQSIGVAISNMKTTAKRSADVALLLMIFTVLVAIVLAFILTRTITRPINHLIAETEKIALGKYEQFNVTSNDEIATLAKSINYMSDEIKKANKYKAHMMQQISHEIQTPLQAMRSAYDILNDQGLGKFSAEQLELLDDFSIGIDKLSNFSQQYLDLAKVESGMMSYHIKSTNLFSVIEPLVKEARLIALRKHISLEMEMQDVPMVMVDAEKISVVISNLLSNAIKYTTSGGNVLLKMVPCTLGVKLVVSDSGIGIIPEELQKVFTRFYQAGNTGKIQGRGTGVGLALVKAYTEGNGGKVYVESTVENGSTFTLELPAVEAAIDNSQISETS